MKYYLLKLAGTLLSVILLSGCVTATSQLGKSEQFDYGHATITQLKKKSRSDDIKAMEWLGYHYHEGDIVKKDYETALEWYRKASNEGSGYAAYQLAKLYEKGHGATRDLKTAASFYQLSAERGNAKGQFKTGYAYEVMNWL